MYYVSRCVYPKSNGPFLDGWIIEHETVYPFYVNKFLHQMNQGSSGTAKQYAYKLCTFLNYLESIHKISYREATTKHLDLYFKYLRYGNPTNIIDISEENKSGFTIRLYYTVIKRFYQYLYQQGIRFQIDIETEKKSKNKYSYLYGQKWDESYAKLKIDNSFERGKPPVKYEKWYTDEQQEAIISNLRTYRDKTIFSISCDGLRIDEILSAQMDLYDNSTGILTLFRSKGRQTGNVDRECLLSERSQQLLQEYFFNERDYVEADLLSVGKIPANEIFINIKKRDETYGKPVQYHNILEIIKRAAKKSGFNPSLIRTHSGRSTKASELFRKQATDPGSLTDNQIQQMMGWKQLSSAEPYKNRQDRETTLANAKILKNAKEKRHNEDS